MMYNSFYFVCLLNGIPPGGQFLAESIVADVAEYDDMIHGNAIEGQFVAIQTFGLWVERSTEHGGHRVRASLLQRVPTPVVRARERNQYPRSFWLRQTRCL